MSVHQLFILWRDQKARYLTSLNFLASKEPPQEIAQRILTVLQRLSRLQIYIAAFDQTPLPVEIVGKPVAVSKGKRVEINLYPNKPISPRSGVGFIRFSIPEPTAELEKSVIEESLEDGRSKSKVWQILEQEIFPYICLLNGTGSSRRLRHARLVEIPPDRRPTPERNPIEAAIATTSEDLAEAEQELVQAEKHGAYAVVREESRVAKFRKSLAALEFVHKLEGTVWQDLQNSAAQFNDPPALSIEEMPQDSMKKKPKATEKTKVVSEIVTNTTKTKEPNSGSTVKKVFNLRKDKIAETNKIEKKAPKIAPQEQPPVLSEPPDRVIALGKVRRGRGNSGNKAISTSVVPPTTVAAEKIVETKPLVETKSSTTNPKILSNRATNKDLTADSRKNVEAKEVLNNAPRKDKDFQEVLEEKFSPQLAPTPTPTPKRHQPDVVLPTPPSSMSNEQRQQWQDVPVEDFNNPDLWVDRHKIKEIYRMTERTYFRLKDKLQNYGLQRYASSQHRSNLYLFYRPDFERALAAYQMEDQRGGRPSSVSPITTKNKVAAKNKAAAKVAVVGKTNVARQDAVSADPVAKEIATTGIEATETTTSIEAANSANTVAATDAVNDKILNKEETVFAGQELNTASLERPVAKTAPLDDAAVIATSPSFETTKYTVGESLLRELLQALQAQNQALEARQDRLEQGLLMLDTELRAQRKLWEQSLNAASAAKADAPVVATTSLLTSKQFRS
jgi:hypothetical protein